MPAEVDPSDFSAFVLATGLGVCVVQAAGNSGFDLDGYEDEQGRRIFRPGDTDFQESGSIIVGAAWSILPHNRAYFSNYGSRVDCYAWGDSVVSAAYGDLDPGDGQPEFWYTSTFSGTSAAAPIIAGAAIWLQCLARSMAGNALSPVEVRALLSDPETGTPQGPEVSGHIGVMPDLCAILEQKSVGIPQAYLRRTCGDDGWDTSGVTCSSPDIFVDSNNPPSLVADGLEHVAPGLSPIPTGSSFIFCHARNRGLGEAPRRAHYYASEPATLIHSEMWQPVGVSPPIAIPQGGDAVRPAAVDLPPTLVAPSDETYLAWLAVLEADTSVTAPPPLRVEWADHLAFLQRADVGCRNTHLIETPQTGASQIDPFAFLFTGAPDQPRTFDFEIVQRLPAGAQVQLSVPQALAVKLRQSQPWKLDGAVPIELPPDPRLTFQRIRLARGSRCESSLTLVPGEAVIKKGHSIAIRQLYEGKEVGRMTCYFQPI